MISISPVDSLDYLNELFKEFGLEINKKSSAVVALFDKERLGVCLYDIDDKGILIRELSPQDDIMLADGILRSALHVAAERSAMDARFSVEMPCEIFEKLGFILNKEERTLNIDKLFGGCCCGK